jgi:hypothetical protein
MKVRKQCPLVLLVGWIGEKVRRSEVQKAEMTNGARREVEQETTLI